DVVNGGGLAVGEDRLQAGVQAIGHFIDRAAGGGPDQGDDALADHSAVEHHVALTLGLHAAGHQGRLGGVEAGNGAAGHGDEHEAPDRLAGGLHVIEVGPQLGDLVGGVGHDAKTHTHGHDDEADAEDGVDLADDLVDGQEGGDGVVGQDEPQPERAHDVLQAGAKVDAAHHRAGSAVTALGQHAGEIVVDAAGKDGAEGDPQEHHRPPQRALHGAEDGAQACNVQQLDQEQFPLRHHDVVDTVVDADRGRFPVIRPEGVVDHFTIGEVANNKESQADQKTNHKITSSKYFSRPVYRLPLSGRPPLF